MSLALLLGAGAGFGLWLLALGLAPARPLLAEGLQRLRLQPAPPPIATPPELPPGPLIRLGNPIARRLLRDGTQAGPWLVTRFASPQDLALLGRAGDRHLAEKIGVAICGLLLPSAVALLLLAGGIALPPLVPLGLAILLAVAGFFLPDWVVRSEARAKRGEFREVLAAFVQVVALSLTADNGLETALGDGAGAGTGWGFEQLRRALRQARFGAETAWAALGRLGVELGVQELEELGARVALAGNDGARVAESLTTFAATLRTRRLAEVESEERISTEKMAAAAVMLFVGYSLFVVLPGFAHLMT
jgi:Flp pilus assembly protein TadB